MATPLSSYDFPRRGKYPWEFWLNGQPWKITHKDIGGASFQTFIVAAGMAARRKGIKVRTHRSGESAVVIQAYLPEEE